LKQPKETIIPAVNSRREIYVVQVIMALLFASGLYLIWSALAGSGDRSAQTGLSRAEFSGSGLGEDTEEGLELPAPGLISRLALRLGVELEPRQARRLLIWSLPGAVAGAIMSILLWNWPVMLPVGAGAGALAPVWVLAGQRSRRKLELQEGLAAACDTLRTLLQFGGLGITSAIGVLSERGPDRLRAEFRTIYEDTRLYELEVSLKLAQQRLNDAQFDLVAMALITADRAGSSVGGVLENLARTIRANLSVTRQVRAEQVKNTLSAGIIALMPLGILTFLKLTSSDYTVPYDTPFGQFVLLVGLLLIALGYLAMRWLARIPGERRTFKGK
jgi:tight adherence protein B